MIDLLDLLERQLSLRDAVAEGRLVAEPEHDGHRWLEELFGLR